MKQFCSAFIKRLQITPKILSPYIKETVDREGTSLRETVVQTFNGDQLLLLTETAKFYLEKGFQITNTTKFIQYRGERVLSDFVEKITDGRVDAIERNQKSTDSYTRLL